jgi:hypothetical protein
MAKPGPIPVLDNPEIVEALCDYLVEGLAMHEACAKPGMPDPATVYRRMSRDPEIASRIARAREQQQEAEAERMVKMADEATPADYRVVDLRIKARQWRAAKLAPKKYGDKLDITSNNEHVAGKDLTDTQRTTRAASILAAAKARSGEPDIDPFS